ncbi:MAG: hypothetical protein ACJ74G_07620 [Blastocatellia bacterium]
MNSRASAVGALCGAAQADVTGVTTGSSEASGRSFSFDTAAPGV